MIRCKRVLDPLVIAPVSFQIKYFHFLLSSILSQLAGERKKTPLRKSVRIPFTRHTWTNPVYPSLLITSAPPSFPPVEFPAVLLNTSTGEIQSEFHTYVQPQEHPVLSEFCTELTGITQVAAALMPADAPMDLLFKKFAVSSDLLVGFCLLLFFPAPQSQVEAGIPLHICLSRFSRWLQKLQLEMGVVFPNGPRRSSAPSPSQKPCAFVTWSGTSQLLQAPFTHRHRSQLTRSSPALEAAAE